MTTEREAALYSVNCECGKWISIQTSETGSAIKCPCGRRVEVPLLEEFQQSSNLLSATTVESRIHRLVDAGALPLVGTCAYCGVDTINVMPAKLDCERASVHRDEGFRIIYIPFLFWMTWEEERRVEVRGHDTVVPAPVCVCNPCQRQFGVPEMSLYAWLPMMLVPIGCVAACFHIGIGLGIAAAGGITGILWIALWRKMALRWHQKLLRNLLIQVPVYRQMLGRYPDAIVVVSRST